MSGNYAVFVTDKRQENLVSCLPGKVKKYDWRRGINADEKAELQKNCDYMVLPIPESKLDRRPDIQDLLNDDYIKFGQNLMEDETVRHRNARITAEATVAELLKYSEYSIRCQKILVTGYGRCGREIANLLSAMGAKVTVLARSRESRRMARAEGHEASDFSYGPEEVYGTKTIVNTVPAIVIREPMLCLMQKDALIIDIASRPGGVDLMAAEQNGIKVVAAPGLPGVYTTKSSAKVLADAILLSTGDEWGKGEKGWIFQILI